MIKTSQTRVLFQRTLSRYRMGVFAAFLAAGVSLSVASLVIGQPAQAATASTLNFQARLLNNSGSIVTDGKYNVQFKLYNAASGGTALWTETYYDTNGAAAGNDNRVSVRAGYLSVYLGSTTAFPSNINWDQDLYLTMNIGGTAQTATPAYDGEMNPRIKLTAVPYAFKAGQLAQLNAATGFTSTLKLAQPTVGSQDFIIPDQGATGTFTLLTSQAANAAYIQNQNALQQASAEFWISGSGRADTSLLTPAVDTATAGTFTIGATNATAVSIARTGVATTVNGSLTVTEDATFNGDVVISGDNTLTVGTGATTLGGTLTVDGTQFTNAGATLNVAGALTNFASDGPIGTAADTVDVKTSFTINQTTTGRTLSLPAPTDTTAGRIVYISNVGSTSFVMHSNVVAAGGNATFLWNGTMWRTIVDSGISAVGTIDSLPKSADGAVVSGSGLYLQTADATHPGLVSTGDQTFAGNKTFTGTTLFKNASNSNFGFEVQTANGDQVMRVDTNTRKVAVGAYSSVAADNINSQFQVLPTSDLRIGTSVKAFSPTYSSNFYEALSSTSALLFNVGSTGTVRSASGTFGGMNQTAASTDSSAAVFTSGNASGATSNTGTVSLLSGNSTTSGNTGGVIIKSGNATSGNSGGVTIDAGTASGATGAISLGVTNASAVSIARTGVLTTVGGSLTVNGTQFTNNGATLNIAKAYTNFASDVAIDTAAASVDIKTSFTINQTTTGRTLSLPAPTDTTAGRIVYISNVGTASFTMHAIVVNAGGNAAFIWNGSAWKPAVDSGISAVGTLDAQAKSVDGAVVVGSAIYLQTADATHAGLVGTGAQTFAGDKTFSGLITGTAGATVSGGAISLTGNAASSFTTTAGDLTLQAGSGTVNLGTTTNLVAGGALTVGSTGALNLGSGGTTGVNLQQNTTVALNKNFTVSGGATSLTGASTGNSAAATINTGAATNIGLLVQGVASQTADLLQVKANGVVAPVLGISANGSATFRNTVDGTNALQVLNAVGNNIVSVGTGTSYTMLLGHSGTGIRGQIGTAVSGVYQGNSVTTRTFSFAKGVPANHTLIGSLVLSAASAPTVSISDTKGNSYTVHVQTTSGSNVGLVIFSSVISNALTTSDSMTLTIASGTGRWLLDVQEFDNILTSGAVDRTATNTNTSIGFSSGITAITQQANELVFGAFGYNAGRTFSPTNGFTGSAQLSTTAGSNDRSLSNVWKFVTTTGTQEATATVNTSSLYAGGVVTFRANAADNGAAAKIAFNDGSSNGFVASLGFSNSLSGNRDIYLPDASGTLCLDSGNCSAAGGYIVNGTALQTGNFNISGTGTVGTSLLTPLLDTPVAGALSIGTGTATSVSISRAGVATTVNGTLNVAESTTIGGSLTINGTQFINRGSTLNTAKALNDQATGAITDGTATNLSDAYTAFTINQTTSGRTLSLPAPTSTTAGRIVYVSNIGSVSFTMHNIIISAGSNASFIWNGTAWKASIDSGISALGTIDSQTKSADGAVVVGSGLYLQTADQNFAGLVSTGTQTFAGDKTFNGQGIFTASGTGLSVTNGASIGGALSVGGNLTVTGSISGNGVNAGSGLLQGTGGLTVTGTTSINTTGTAATAIGNATGAFSLLSSGLNVSTAGVLTGVSGITTTGGYTQTGVAANTFSGATSFTAAGLGLSVTNSASIGGNAAITGTLSVGGGVVAGAQISATSGAAGQIAGALKGAVGQTADLLQLQNSSNEVLARFSNTGQLTLGRISSTGTAAAGVITLADGTNSNFGATLSSATLTANRSFVLPDSSLATTASPATFCVYNGTTSNCPIAPGSPHYIQNGTTVQSSANFNIRSAGANNVVGVLEGANGQTADLLNLNSFNGTASTTVARITAAGNLQVATSIDTTTATALSLGTTNANAINIASTGVATTVNGTLTVAEDATFNGNVDITGANTLTVGGDATVGGSLTVSGTQFTNAGATLNTAKAYTNFASDGAIDIAAASVDIKTTFTINQTTSGRTLSLPAPTNTAAGRIVYVSNIGSASFTMNNAVVPAAGNAVFLWNGSAWKPTVEAGISAVGNLDGQPKNDDGATVFAGALYLQTADATHPGLVSTGDQTFAGNKTFDGTVAIQGAGTGLDVANNASIGGNLTVTGSISGNGVNAGTGVIQGTGGLTVTGTTNINTTGTANTSIGNATGTFILNSANFDVSAAGTIATNGGYTQTGTSTNTFTGVTTFSAAGTGLSVSNNLSAGTINNLTLAAALDGFSIAGGSTTSRTLTVTGANITIGDVIRPTNPGTLAVRSNGANVLTLDAGGAAAVNVGTTNASGVSISKLNATTAVNGALSVAQLITGNAGATVSGGAVSLTGNAASSLTTTSGALTLTSAAAATWSTTAGNLTIQAGSGTVSLGNSTALSANGTLNITSGGAMTIDAGAGTGLSLGATNANAVTIARTGVATSVNGTLTVAEAATFNGNVDITGSNTFTVGTGATTLGGTLTINGTQLTNNGSTLNGVVAIGNIAAGGNIGTAASTVDIKTAFTINQTTAGQALTLPTPTDTTAGRIVYVSNVGTQSFTMYGAIVSAGNNASFIWNGAAWNATVTAGVTSLGNVDGQTRNAFGGTVVGSLLYLQTADQSNAGLVGTGAQTFSGDKTFNGQGIFAASGTGLSVTNNASVGGTLTVGGNLTVTGSISGNGVNAGNGLLQGTGGLSVTGSTSINTTGSANTAIGNATGTFTLQSSGLKVSAAGALTGVSGITTSGGYTQSGTSTNTFTGVSTFSAAGTALSVTNNLSAGTINNLTLTSAADGFTIAGGTASRTLTVTGASITIGNTIRPTNPGVLGVQSNGANALSLDAGGTAAVNVGTTNADAVNISRNGVTTNVNGALTVSQLITGNAGATVSGGAVSLTGNVASSLTTTAGALTLTSAAATTWSTTTGNLTIQAGSGTVSLGTSTALTANGALTITSGTAGAMAVDAGGAANLDLGTTNASGVNISRTGVATTINGSLTVAQAATFNGNVDITGGSTLTVGTGATTLGGTLTVNGTQFTNAGATLNASGSTMSDFAVDGDIGAAGATVDVKTSFRINQQTGSGNRILGLPSPTNTTAGRIVYVMNVGSAAFTMHGSIVSAGSNASFLWNGSAWKATADAGIAAVGALDSQLPKSVNGAQAIGSGLYLQTADQNFAGLMSTGTQTFAGAKTFNGGVTLAAAGTGLSVTNNATIGGTLGVTGAATFGGNISQSGAGTFSTGTGAVSLNGNVSVANGRTLTVGTGATSLGGTLTVAGNTTLNGSQLTNAGATLNTALALSSQPAGVINGGDATTSVDSKTVITINQTGTSGLALSLPNPTTTTAGRIVYVSNTGSVDFVMAGATVGPGQTIGFLWNGSTWTTTGSGAGVSRMGLLNGQTKNANGAAISGNTLYLQTADDSNPGLVSTLGQSFAGAKTFINLITGNAGLTVTGGAVSLTGNAASSLTTTAGALSLQGFAGVSVSTPNATGTTSDVTINTGNSTSAGNSGAVTIQSGNAAGGTAGTITVDTGTSSTGTSQIAIGTANAGAVSVGRAGFTTTVNGALTVSQLLTGNAGATVSGGAIALTASGASSFTTTGGALTLTSATAATWSTTTGNLTIQAGSGTVSLGTSSVLTADGALAVRSGGASTMTVDAGGAASLNLGTTNANGVSISRTNVATTINGSLTVQQASTFNGNVSISGTNTLTVGSGATSLGGTLTVAGNTTLNGAQFTNNGSTLNSVLPLGNFTSDAPIGTAAATVDIKSGFTINQTTAGISLTIPTPTNTAAGRIIYVSNIGTQPVVISSLAIAAGSNGTFLWNGSSWKGATEGGASTIGTLDGNTPKSANGASIVGNLFYFQTADQDFAGLVSTGNQTFAGNKTFTGQGSFTAAGTGLSVTNNATIGGNLTVTGSISGNGVNSGAGLIQGTGGLTVTGATSINTTGTANTSIGNATGSLTLESANFDVSAAGAIATNGGYTQTGTGTNTFTGVSTFSAAGTALTVSNNLSAGTVNNLTLTAVTDGFTIAGGSTSRTLTVTGGDITVGNVIQPTNAGTLGIRSNGANALAIDAGGAAPVNIGLTSANAVAISRTGVTTTVNGALTVSQLLTGNAGATISGGAIALTANADSSFTTSSGALTLTSAAAAIWKTNAGNLTIQAGSGTVSLGTSTNLTASGALTITSGGTGAMTVDAGGAAALNLGTNNANGVSISRTGVLTTVNGNLTVTGVGVFRNGSNVNNAFQVQKSDNTAMLNVDTLNGWVINNGSTHAGNLLENPSFESNGAFSASGWNFSSQATIATDSGNARTGNNVFTLTPNGTLMSMSPIKYLAVVPGEQYYAEVWYKTAAGTDGGSTAGSVSLTYYGANKTSIGNSTFTQFNSSNNSYTRAIVNGTVPAGAVYMRLTWGINAASTTGTWYFDDFYLTKASQQSPMTFKNNVDSTSAFRIQNAGGNDIFTADTAGNQVVLGKASTLDGKLTFQNASNANTASIVSGVTSSNYTLTLPTGLGGAGQCLVDTNGSGALGFTSCVTTAVTLQSAYTNGTASNPEIKLDSVRGGLDLQDSDAGLTNNNFIALRGSNATGLGTIRFSVNTNGNLYMKPASDSFSLIDIRRANDSGLMILDSSSGNGRLGIALGGTGTNPTLPSFTLDVGGDINTSTRILAPTHDTGASATMNVGTANATAVSISRTGMATTINGSLSVEQASTLKGNVSITGSSTLTVGTGLTQLGGNLTVAGTVQLNGTQVTNAGATLNTVLSLGDQPAGAINGGNAATSVDVKTAIAIAQSSTGLTLSLPNPTSTTAGRIVYVINSGTADFTMHNVLVKAGNNAAFIWNGSAWAAMIQGGVTTMGSVDGQARNAFGGTIVGNSLYLQTADGTNPGLVSAAAQTFGGDKTFSGAVTVNGASGLSVTNNASIGGNLTVTGSISGNSVNAGSGLIQGTGGLTVTGATNINTTGTANTSIGNTTGTFALESANFDVSTVGTITTNGGYNQTGSVTNSFSGVTTFSAANGVVLGASNTATGGIVFRGAGGNGTLTLAGPTTPNAGNYTLSIPAITGNQTVCVSGTVCAGYAAAPASGAFLQQSPDDNLVNTITPASGVIGLTVNGAASSSVAMVVNQAQGGDGMTIRMMNTSGTQSNGLSITRNAAGGTTQNLLNLGNATGNGSVDNAIRITGTYNNLISSPTFTVTNAGALSAVGVNAGSGLIQGTGGLTVTGATSINTGSSTANTSIGNATGSLTLESANFDVSTAGTISTNGGYNQTGSVTNSFTGVTNFTAAGGISVTNNISAGSINNLTLTSAADGFTASGGTASRTLTVAGASITVGSTIQPTALGALSIQSNGANTMTVDAGTTLRLGTANATRVDIAKSNVTTYVLGAVNVAQNADFAGNITQTGSTNFSTGTGTVTFNGSTSVSGTNSFDVGTGATTLGGTLRVNGTQFTNNGSTLNGVTQLGPFSSNQAIGTAASTVDVKTAFTIPQDVQNISLTIPSPTITTAGRIIYISNTGIYTFNINGNTIQPGTTFTFMWNGSAWTYTGAAAGVNTVGSFVSSGGTSANGATISGTTISFQAANGSAPGMVSTIDQTFAGAKTFNNLITGSGGMTISGGALNLTGNTGSTIATSAGALDITSATAANWITNSGNLTIQAGSGTVSLGSSTIFTAGGALNVRSGGTASISVDTSSTSAAVNIGTGFANAINMGANGVTTTNNGNFTSIGNTTIGTGAISLMTNNGATLNTARVLTNVPTGNITTASEISGYTMFNVNQNITGQTLTIPTPTVPSGATTAAGRIIYISNIGTQIFAINGLGGSTTITFAPNATIGLIWNGSIWTSIGAGTIGALDGQTASANGATYVGNVLYLQSATKDAPGLVNNAAQTFSGLKTFVGGAAVTTSSATAFQVQNAAGAASLTVDTQTGTASNWAVNGGAETSGGSAPASWTVHGSSASISNGTSSGEFASGLASAKIAVTGSNSGARNNLGTALLPGNYLVSFSIKTNTGGDLPAANLAVQYFRDGSTAEAMCTTSNQVSTISNNFVKYTCALTVGTLGNSFAFLAIYQTDSTVRTLYIDNLSILAQNTTGALSTNRLVVGGDTTQGLTIFTLDKSAGPPQAGNGGSTINPSLYGSMYFDTTLGRIQCYESNGWGSCGNVPDVSVNLIPEYTGAVLNGSGVGTMTADLCSGSSRLSINTSICGASEDYNYYKWTSPQATSQTYSIYVRYQLPANFKDFADQNTIQLTGRTTSTADGSVNFTMYKPDGTICGSTTSVIPTSGGSANTWYTTSLSGDERTCTQANGGTIGPNSIVLFKIDVTARSNATVYVSNLSFLTKGK